MLRKKFTLKREESYPIFHFRPLIFMGISTVLGILAVWNGMNGTLLPLYIATFCVLFLCLLPVLERKCCKKGEVFALISLSLLFFTTSGAITALNVQSYRSEEIKEGYYTICGTVTDVSIGDELKTLVLTDITFSSFSETVSSSFDMQLYIHEFTEDSVQVGDIVSCYSHLYLQEENGEYETYFVLNGYKYRAFTTEKDLSVIGKTNNFFLRARITVENLLSRGMSKEAAGISAGLLFGNTDGMEEETIENYRNLGISHVFAVSGLHIGFLCGLILLFFRRVEKRNPLRFILPTVCVFFYAGMCGFTPSSVRAAIMCATTLFLTMIGAPADRLNGILFSAILILLCNPMDLFSYGFQLSYVCVLSIVFITPVFRKIFRFLPEKIGESVSIALGVQIGVFPLQMILFGYASPISILLNLILVPLISVIYSFIVILVVISLLVPILPNFLEAVEWIIRAISSLLSKISNDRMMVRNLDFSKSYAFYYAAFAVISPQLNLKGKIRVGLFVVFVLLCVAATII